MYYKFKFATKQCSHLPCQVHLTHFNIYSSHTIYSWLFSLSYRHYLGDSHISWLFRNVKQGLIHGKIEDRRMDPSIGHDPILSYYYIFVIRFHLWLKLPTLPRSCWYIYLALMSKNRVYIIHKYFFINW